MTRILDGKNIKYELVDISQDNALREEMRAKAGNPKAIPPQIVNGDQYCGVRLRWGSVLRELDWRAVTLSPWFCCKCPRDAFGKVFPLEVHGQKAVGVNLHLEHSAVLGCLCVPTGSGAGLCGAGVTLPHHLPRNLLAAALCTFVLGAGRAALPAWRQRAAHGRWGCVPLACEQPGALFPAGL